MKGSFTVDLLVAVLLGACVGYSIRIGFFLGVPWQVLLAVQYTLKMRRGG